MISFTLRHARDADIPALVDLCLRYVTEAAPGFPAASPDLIANELAIGLPGIVLTETEGGIVGILWLKRDRFWWSERTFVGDKLFYVVPEARKLGVAKTLMDYARQAAAHNRMPLTMAVIAGTDVERKDHWYERVGKLTRIGGVFAAGWDAA